MATSFKYNGDGTLVAKLVGNVATYYIGGIYEVQTSTDINNHVTIDKKTYYYPAGGAIRVEDISNPINSGLFYVLKDHLGSASVTLYGDGLNVGNVAAEMRYYPFGETRVSSGTIPTDQRFQGQREVSGLDGLMQFGARFYLPSPRRPGICSVHYCLTGIFFRGPQVQFVDYAGVKTLILKIAEAMVKPPDY